jgi:hypothetical protein
MEQGEEDHELRSEGFGCCFHVPSRQGSWASAQLRPCGKETLDEAYDEDYDETYCGCGRIRNHFSLFK